MRAHTTSLALALAACATVQHPFPNREPMRADRDRALFEGPPRELYTPARWDAVDSTIFRPLAELFALEPSREAINVNALDEVPDSSWFENRTRSVDAEAIARGACGEEGPPEPPFFVIGRKREGSRPGFVMRSADGRRYFVRTDETLRERSTATDAIATRLVWAAGYHTPCNHVAFVRPDEIVLDPDPDDEDPPTQVDVDRVIGRSTRTEDGRLRLGVSRFIEGEPIGGWQFWGMRGDDPNDVVPHEHRRDVRGMVMLSAWLNHIDSRSENNLDAWVEVEGGRGYVRHYVLDLSESFGVIWAESYLMGMRFGVSHYVDLQHILEDFLTLGMLDRPYYVEDDERGPAAHVLGYYDVERFDPEGWRNGYPNPAFDRATERDRAWMARILAELDEEEIDAAVQTGRFSRALYSGELLRILMGRRERILERYLTRLSPLAHPVLDARQLCLEDLAVRGGVRRARDRRYRARAFRGWPASSPEPLPTHAEGARACVTLPSAAPNGAAAYWIVDIVASSGSEVAAPARVHLYELAPGRYRVVGLERPATHAAPG